MNNTPSQTFINQICELYGDVYDDRQEDSKINGRDWKPGEKSWHKSMQAFQEELATKGINLSTSKLRKILITGGCWSTVQSREIQKLFDRYESVARVAAELELSEAYVVMNLPYSRVVYDLEEKSETAKRLNKHRGRGRTISLSGISDRTSSEHNDTDKKRTGRKGSMLINPKIAEGLDRTRWKPENTEDDEAMDWALQQTMGETEKGDRLEFVVYSQAATRLYCAEIVKKGGERKISELKNSPLGDGSCIIYVNGQYRDTDTPIGKLMHDFSCSKADDILNPILRDRVKILKETERGRQEVCKIMENRITEEKIEMAKREIKLGELTLEQIARVYELALPIVEELARTVAVGA